MGQYRAPNDPYATSYRSELLREYFTTKCLHRHATQTIDQVCGNKRAVEVITAPIYNPTQMLDSDMDLILASKHERQQSTYPSKPEWVKGHTDDKDPKGKRTPKEEINIIADDKSKSVRTNMEPEQPPEPFPGSGAMLIIDGKWIMAGYKEQLTIALTKPRHRKYFLQRFKTTDKVYDDILWECIGSARRNIRHRMNTRISKYMYDWMHTGKQKGLFGDDGTCPCCGAQEETQAHIFQCMNPTIVRARETSIKSFTSHLQQHRIPPELIECAVELVKAFFNKSEPKIRQISATTKQIIDAQQKIGIESFTRGFLSKQWLTSLIRMKSNQPKTKIKTIIQGLWHHIMEQIWEAHNNILHKTDNIVTQTARRQANGKLLDWKTLASERLHHSQQHLVAYCKSDFKFWTLQHKHNTLHILQQAHKNYKQYLKADNTEGIQTLITRYIPTA